MKALHVNTCEMQIRRKLMNLKHLSEKKSYWNKLAQDSN